MGLIDRARAAVKKYTSNIDGGAVVITIMKPDKSLSVDISGVHTRINLGVDEEGNIMQSRKSYVSIAESLLNDNNYPVRNGNAEIDLKGHLIYVQDTFGLNVYAITSVIANDTVGNLVCMLADYQDA
ncbi:MAG TPA: hypothetical protein VN922_19670 [Bacteroidia bacterium]|nr:hypothetical protein [Bacteroidia bacterium]